MSEHAFIETALYRVPLPEGWARHALEPGSELELELRQGEASIRIRTARRMPSIESFQGPGHVFRDIGQLERAGFIEFEHSEGERTWLFRHEQLHRGMTPFVVTLRAPLDQASEHMAALARVVEQLQLRAM